MKRKWIWGIAITLLLAVMLTTVGLAVAGGTDDPLVALSYLTGAYKQNLLDEAQTKIDAQVDAAAWEIEYKLDALDGVTIAPSQSGSTGYWRVSLAAGETISFDVGTEILFLYGGATVESGSLSDSTDGVILGVSAATAVNHLHIGVTAGTLYVTEASEILICE